MFLWMESRVLCFFGVRPRSTYICFPLRHPLALRGRFEPLALGKNLSLLSVVSWYPRVDKLALEVCRARLNRATTRSKRGWGPDSGHMKVICIYMYIISSSLLRLLLLCSYLAARAYSPQHSLT